MHHSLRPWILHTVKNLCRETGGVPLAVINILKALAKKYPYYDFVLAAHPGPSPLLSSSELEIFPPNFQWVPLASNQASSLSKYIRQCDRDRNLPCLIHDHGIWLPNNHAIASVSRHFKIPRVVSIHGMLEPWAWQHKGWKKKIAWHIFQKSDLETAQVLHSTSNLETFHIQQFLPKHVITSIPLGVDLSPTQRSHFQQKNTLSQKTLLFLSRIHQKKGIENLISAFKQINNDDWQLIIAGSTDDIEYFNHLKSLVIKNNLQDVIHFIGAVQDNKKLKVLETADLFVLPTFSENFGIVVAEALGSGIPVITTKAAPWSDLVTHQCGWWIDIGVEPLVAALQEAMSLSSRKRRAMGQRGRQLIEQHYTWEQTASKLMDVYEAILNTQPIPYRN